MLRPGTRLVYLDALKPPPGFTLDCAVGTTYSLDLETLLVVPLGFAMLDWENERGALARDPVALLHALRSYAERVTLFCQAGRIAAPARHYPLFAHLEAMIVQANAPDPFGSFHAKTWLLRFLGEGGNVLYRFICLSRNLTPDRSWDTLLSLDGQLLDRRRAIARNHALGDFIAALPGLAQSAVAAPRREAIARLSDEVRRAQFIPPEPFEDLVFWPLGLRGLKRDPLADRIDRLLVLSPFLSDSFLEHHEVGTLISRAESLESMEPRILKQIPRVYALDDAAVEEERDEGQAMAGADTTDTNGSVRGLHAKLFVADQGWDASVWTGSANATAAAFKRNVEFLVQLKGRKSSVGIDTFLGTGEDAGFGDLLRPFVARERTQPDAEVVANEERAEDLRRWFAQAPLVLRVDQEPEGKFALNLRLEGDGRPSLEGASVHCWPASSDASMAIDLEQLWQKGAIRFADLRLRELTSFIVFRVTVGRGLKRALARFTLNLPLEGVPEDRLDQVLHLVLGNREHLLRYLLFLLTREDDLAAVGAHLLQSYEDADPRDGAGPAFSLPLFEELLRTLARSPQKLASIARLVEDLKRTADGAALLPEDFERVWDAVWQARPPHLGGKST